MDASIIEAPRGSKREDGSSTRDKEASYTKKHDRTYHGFKGHIATDVKGIIMDYRFTTTKVHDSQCMDELIQKEKRTVYADSAYMIRDRKKRLKIVACIAGSPSVVFAVRKNCRIVSS